MAIRLLSAIPEVNDDVLTLRVAIQDAFDFANHEDTLKSIKPGSKRAQILTLLLQEVCACGDFIQWYTKDSQFRMLFYLLHWPV